MKLLCNDCIVEALFKKSWIASQTAFSSDPAGPWATCTVHHSGCSNPKELHPAHAGQEARAKRALNINASEHGGFASLSAEQWNIVCNLIDTLPPVEEVTLEMSHYDSSASCIISSVKVLKMLLSSQGPSSHGIKTMRQEMLESLTRRFAKVEVVKCAVLAGLLFCALSDPSIVGV